jgi:MFS family permease
MLSEILWIVSASLLSFSIAAIFSGWLKLRRNVYLIFYIILVAVFFAGFIVNNGINVPQLFSHNWYWGLVGALIAGAMAISNVLKQPASERLKGWAYIIDILWPGFFYGLTDALLLSVLPIVAVKLALTGAEWTSGLMGQIGAGALALLASLVVTAAYHWGYPEFRNKRVLWTMMGNGIFSLAFIITMNPMAAILPHIAMHIAAMTHGRETTGQVPPHYS